MNKHWVSLHNHTEFSLLDGATKVFELMERIKNIGQQAVAVTDHGNLFGVIKATEAAKKHGVKLIVGSELYIAPMGRSRFDKDYKKGEKHSHHLVLLAKNRVGYRNLSILSSQGYSQGFYYTPRIDRELLEQYSEGLIATTSCMGGPIPATISAGDFHKAEKDMQWFQRVFGEDFYVEIHRHNIPEEEELMQYMRQVAKQYSIPTIVATDSHYLLEEDAMIHDVLLCVGTGDWVDNPNRRMKFSGNGYHIMTEAEVLKRFPHDVDAIYRTGEIADKIEENVIQFNKTEIPVFEVPEDMAFENWRKNKGESPVWRLLRGQ